MKDRDMFKSMKEEIAALQNELKEFMIARKLARTTKEFLMNYLIKVLSIRMENYCNLSLNS